MTGHVPEEEEDRPGALSSRSPTADLADRLRRIDALRLEDLITVDEYEAKRAALLAEL
jgi:hypothetical protein